jgi:polyisoprenoid-binding protein YceI
MLRYKPTASRRVAPTLAAFFACAVAFQASAQTPAAKAAQRYVLDPAHSFVTFEVLHFGTSTLRGRWGPLQGEVTLGPAADQGEVGLTIDMAQVDTGLRMLDKRLCAPDLLACTDFPQAWFVARHFQFAADGSVSSVRGELTLRGVSAGLTLTALHYGCHAQPDTGRRVCGGDFEGELARSYFGAGWGAPFVADRVRLVVQVEGVAATP